MKRNISGDITSRIAIAIYIDLLNFNIGRVTTDDRYASYANFSDRLHFDTAHIYRFLA